MAQIYDSTHSGQEVDRAVEAALTTIPAQLTQIGSEVIPAKYTNAYVKTSDPIGTVVNINSPVNLSPWMCYVSPCIEGDVAIVYGTGGQSPRLWAFLDADYKILSQSAANATGENIAVTAPTNAAWVVINDNSGKSSYIKTTGSVSANTLRLREQDEINEKVDEDIDSLKTRENAAEQDIVQLKIGIGYTIQVPISATGSKYIEIPNIISGHTYLIRVSADTSIGVSQPSFSTGKSSSTITDYISPAININVVAGKPMVFILKTTADASYFHYYIGSGTLDNLLFEILDLDEYASLLKNKGEINVASFGANGAAVGMAISYAQYAGANRIVIPNGTYEFDAGITIPDGFSVVGESRDGVVLKASASFSGDYLVTISSKTKLSDLTIDGNNKPLTCVYGYQITDSLVENIVAKNVAAVTSSRHLVFIKTSTNVTIKDCVLHDISHKASGGSARGLSFQNSFYCSALNCEIYNILRLDVEEDETESATIDTDGVWVHTDNAESISGNIIEKCNIYDCRGRFVKIQQWGVTIKDCHLHKESGALSEAVGVYDSHTTIDNCTIDGTGNLTIHVGGISQTDGANECIRITNCSITHRGTAYQAAIMLRDRPARNILISDNIFNVISSTEDVVQVRGGSNFRTGMYGNYTIANNQIIGDANTLFHAKGDEFSSSYLRNVLLSSNICFLHSNLIKMEGSSTSFFLGGTLIGNRGTLSSAYGGNIINASDDFKKKFTYVGNYFGSTIVDGFRTIGSSTQRPTGIGEGFIYYDSTLKKSIIYNGSAWVNMDGTALA